MTIQKQYGELALAYTTAFDFRWNDRGTGGDHDGGYWQPIPPSGFYALGGIGVGTHSDVKDKFAALCVSGPVRKDDSGSEPLAHPIRYDRIWKDSGSGGKYNGSCWRPIAPAGYVAMGDVFMKGHDTEPALTEVVCVRRNLTHQAVAGDSIWNDRGTGSDKSFGSWKVVPPPAFVDPELGLIAAETYVGVESHTKPEFDAVLNVLMLPLPTEEFTTPQPPVLTSRSAPAERTPDVTDRIVYVPFTAITDTAHDVAWKVLNSPFYAVQRQVCYRLLIFQDNRTSTTQHKSDDTTVGVSTSQSDTFSVQTGISVTEEAGVSFIEDAKVSATVSIQLGFSHTTSVTDLQSRTVVRSLETPPNTAAGLWVTTYTLQAVRADGSRVGTPLSLDIEAFYSSQYPAVPEGSASAARVITDLDPAKIGASAQV